ncbi:MAG: NAD-dependent epimerase/dehydratase family protein [bacterium]|nr:NAD-dependent epimerase/dehydratase family protein [bacterium]
MAKKIFLFGATGYIGTRVCKELHHKGYEIYSFVRQGSNREPVKPYVKDFIEGNLGEEADRAKIIDYITGAKIPGLISMAGSVDYHQDYETSRKANVETTANIIEIAVKLRERKALKRMVFLGSVASRGFLREKPAPEAYITETTDYYHKGDSVYCDVKREAQDLVARAIKEEKLSAIIIAPGSLTGKGMGDTTTTNIGLVRKILKGIPILKGGASYIAVSSVSRGIVQAYEKGTPGHTYLLGGENMTMKEFGQMVRTVGHEKYPDQISQKIPVLTIPRLLAKILGKLHVIMNSQQALLGNTFHYINSEKAKKELGYTHTREDLEAAILEMLE